MKRILKKPLAATATLAVASAFIGSYHNSIMHGFFGKKSDDKNNTDKPTKTYIWGNGFYQARPDIGLSFKNFEPKLIKNFLGDKTPNMKDITFGEFHEAGIDSKGNVYVWDKHRIDSAVENKDNERNNVIVLDSGKNNKQIIFSKGFLWILKDNGEVHQHVINRSQSTKPDEEDIIEIIKAPRKIQELKGITQIGTGEDHFVALDKNGEVWVMGDDTLGQCGQGSENRSTSPPFYEKRLKKPKKMESFGNIQKIACGGNHTLALTKDGVVYGWGSNASMQLSHQEEFARVDNPLVAAFAPIKIDKNMGSLIATDIAAGKDFSIFVGRNRNNNETEVFGCGHNMHGELGGGNMSHVQDIIKIESLSNYRISTPEGEKDVRVNKISCGNNHCMAHLNVGAVLEWGSNEFGQLGNRKRVFSENPIILKTFATQNVLNISCAEDNSAVICEDETPAKP